MNLSSCTKSRYSPVERTFEKSNRKVSLRCFNDKLQSFVDLKGGGGGGEKLNYQMVAMYDFQPSYLGLLNFPGFEVWL